MVTGLPTHPVTSCHAPYRAGIALQAKEFQNLRRELILHGHKWDSQVSDVTTIAPFPILLGTAEWNKLSAVAEVLAAELAAAEAELLHRPALHKVLAIPRQLRRLFRTAADHAPSPAAGRILRFDFHWTDDGWRISEVNSDVPGGFTEASNLSAMMAHHFSGTASAGRPESAWINSIIATAQGKPVALLSAAGFMEDQQIMAYLAEQLSQRGHIGHLAGLSNIVWKEGRANLNTQWHQGEVGAIVRFYQAEWLGALPHRAGWEPLFFGGQTPVANPGIAVLIESKRFPLVWDDLATRLPTWRKLLPETHDPRDAAWKHDESWLVKSAFCNTGDTVAMRDLLTPRQWNAVRRSVWLRPSQWIAQRRFSAIPLDTPIGTVYPCIGVYTVNSQACGIYGRLSPRHLIDFAAIDVAVLIEDDHEAGGRDEQ